MSLYICLPMVDPVGAGPEAQNPSSSFHHTDFWGPPNFIKREWGGGLSLPCTQIHWSSYTETLAPSFFEIMYLPLLLIIIASLNAKIHGLNLIRTCHNHNLTRTACTRSHVFRYIENKERSGKKSLNPLLPGLDVHSQTKSFD